MQQSDRVEGDVDAAGLGRDHIGMRLHRLLIQGVDLGDLDLAAVSRYVGCDLHELARVRAGQEHPGTFAREGTRYGAANGAAAAIDDGGFIRRA